jgi:hypothetical protein
VPDRPSVPEYRQPEETKSKFLDTSVHVYFGPKSPAGKGNNGVQTIPGKGWNVILRLYGSLKPHGSTSRDGPASLNYCSDEEFNSTEANRGKMFNHPILVTLGSTALYWTKVQYLNV